MKKLIIKKQFIPFLIIGLITTFTLSCEKEEVEDTVIEPTLTTLEVTEITKTSAESGGDITDDGGAEIESRGLVWDVNPNPTIEDNEGMITEGSGIGKFTSNMTELSPEIEYYVRAWATNSQGTAYGEQISFKTHLEDGPGDGVTDIDGNTYSTVIIGNQEWMAENLRVTQYNNGDAIPTGLSNTDWENTTDGAYAIYPHGSISGLESEAEVVEAYGKLYNWYAVDDARGLCPAGWRVPTDAEWTELDNYVVGQGYPNDDVVNGAGNALKSCRQVDSPLGGECATSEHPRWDSDGTHYGFDEFGFSALPGGFRGSTGAFLSIGGLGSWWSFTEDSSTIAWGRPLDYYLGDVDRLSFSKSLGFSVRCFRDL